VATLAVTPLRRFLGLNLLKFRRALGLMVFFFVLAHFLVWALLDVQAAGAVWADILKRPYITDRHGRLRDADPAALTSNTEFRRLAARAAAQLHWLTYPSRCWGGALRLARRGFAIEPLVYLGLSWPSGHEPPFGGSSRPDPAARASPPVTCCGAGAARRGPG
jgi:sulfoxide reductase heme-binding subunit YedZ